MGYLGGRQASENFNFIKELHRSALDQGFGLARWVMASLLLVNGGALAALVGAAEKNASLVEAVGYFVVGTILAIAAGIAAWFNFNLVAEAASERMDWVKLEADDPPRADFFDKAAWVFSGMSILFAFGSLAFFAGGANVAGAGLKASVRSAPTLQPAPPPIGSSMK